MNPGRLPRPAAWFLCWAGAGLTLACLWELVRFGFRRVLAYWLALGLSAAFAGWLLASGPDAGRGGPRT